MVKENVKEILNSKRRGKNKEQTVHPPQVVPWGISCVNADKVSQTGTNIKVGVIDTGIDYSHQDLINNVKGGFNTIRRRNKYKNPFDEFDDDNGHGTHVEGTIAALNNSIGVVGVDQILIYMELKS